MAILQKRWLWKRYFPDDATWMDYGGSMAGERLRSPGPAQFDPDCCGARMLRAATLGW
jgi:hypothetical protein